MLISEILPLCQIGLLPATIVVVQTPELLVVAPFCQHEEVFILCDLPFQLLTCLAISPIMCFRHAGACKQDMIGRLFLLD